ncbi:MAG: DNA polymerase I [Clostridia bacterium]|nr:DNA polymerase I [Clostridia bacterium]
MKGKTEQKLLIAIDGNSLLYQAYYAFFKANLTTRDGFPTGALKGFFTKLQELWKREPSHMLVAFDVHGPTFRHERYAEYKAGRTPPTEDFLKQLAEIRVLLPKMGVAVIECPGYEADDILGTFARKAETAGLETLIVTGDRDSFQLITPHTKIYYTKDNSEIDEAALMERYGLTPDRMRDLKALMGDSSDNIPGIAGVGEKTALKLLDDYGDLEGVLAHAPEIKGKLGERVRDGAESARFSYWLGTIDCSAPVKETLADCAFDFAATAGGKARLTELELFSVAKHLPEPADAPATRLAVEAETVSVSDGAAMRAILERGAAAKEIAVLTEPMLGFAFDDKTAYTISAGETLFDVPMEEGEAYAILSDWLSKNRVSVLAYEGKNLLHKLNRAEDAPIAFDAKIADYLLQSNRPSESFAALCAAQLGTDRPNAACLFALRAPMESALLASGMDALYRDMELPLQTVLFDMERTGVRVDGAVLGELHDRFREAAEALEDRIYERAGERFNILSTKQLGHILFEKLELPAQKKTKTGYSTDAEALEAIAGLDPIVPDVLQYRFLTKLDSTFAEGLRKQQAADGRIHTRFMQCVTATGRISSVEPNLQNIPVRTAEGREIRKAFIPSEGNVLVGADYSQIELRLLAHISGDPSFIEAFHSGEDIHARTAAEVFHTPLEQVTPEQRSAAKAVNFGIVYGISDFGLAKNLGVSVKTASSYIRRYFERYPGVKSYLEESVAAGKANGYAVTLFGRRRPLPELKSSNYNVRQFGERVAMNMPIQGSAADMIKLAMIAVHDRLQQNGMRAKLVLQIHDELIVDAPREEAEEVAALMQDCMEHVIALKVQLVAEAKIGESWFETK